MTDSGDLSVNTSCALEGGDCLAALIDDTTNIYVKDDTPTDETDYQVRFLFDPNDLTMANGDELDLFLMGEDGAGSAVSKVQFHFDTTEGYEIRLQVNNDGGTGSFTDWYPIDDDVHEIVVEWWADTDGGADSGGDDGTARLWIDGDLIQTLTGIDSDTRQVDYTRLGAVSGIDATTSGTMYFDDYASWTEAEGIVYDGTGTRVKTVINNITTIYVSDYEKDITNSVERTYYNGAMRVDDGTNDDVYWVLKDHLGGTSVIANTDTTQHSESRYKAWGETRYTNGTLPTDVLFTGQREEADIGLYFYNARWYDPALGRFLQADTFVPQEGNPSAYDRYAYVYNNPVKYTDPTGHFSDEELFLYLGFTSQSEYDTWMRSLDDDVRNMLYAAQLGDILGVEGGFGELGETETRYYMFALTEDGKLVFWDIENKYSISTNSMMHQLQNMHKNPWALFVPITPGVLTKYKQSGHNNGYITAPGKLGDITDLLEDQEGGNESLSISTTYGTPAQWVLFMTAIGTGILGLGSIGLGIIALLLAPETAGVSVIFGIFELLVGAGLLFISFVEFSVAVYEIITTKSQTPVVSSN